MLGEQAVSPTCDVIFMGSSKENILSKNAEMYGQNLIGVTVSNTLTKLSVTWWWIMGFCSEICRCGLLKMEREGFAEVDLTM